MKIIAYSDLHLEFGTNFKPPSSDAADVMILAGDIITFKDFEPLGWFLENWENPVLYVAGNHEYYTREPMDEGESKLKEWLAAKLPHVKFLQDEAVTINGVNFFGGTMWTDFNNSDFDAMRAAWRGMNDYRLIYNSYALLEPIDTVRFHEKYVQKLLKWFKAGRKGEHVVISHHAPVINPKTNYGSSPIMPAFNSLDMADMIKKYQPSLWVYGHTHECDNQKLGRTRIVSNQLGYPDGSGGHECEGFDAAGRPVEV